MLLISMSAIIQAKITYYTTWANQIRRNVMIYNSGLIIKHLKKFAWTYQSVTKYIKY